jgi:hypothetical protein
MTRAIRILQLIEDATEPQGPQEPDPHGDKERKKADQGYNLAPPKKAKKVFMLDGSYDDDESPGFHVGCPKCGEVQKGERQPKGDVTDNLCRHCEEPLVLMGSTGPTSADSKVVDRGKERARRAAEKYKKQKAKKEKANVASKSTNK